MNKIALLAILLLAAADAFAGDVKTRERKDTVVKKDGSRVECQVLADGEKAVVVIIGEEEKILPKEEVEKIEYAKDEEQPVCYQTENVDGILMVTAKGEETPAEPAQPEDATKAQPKKQPQPKPVNQPAPAPQKQPKPTPQVKQGKQGQAPTAQLPQAPALDPAQMKEIRDQISRLREHGLTAGELEQAKQVLKQYGYTEQQAEEFIGRFNKAPSGGGAKR